MTTLRESPSLGRPIRMDADLGELGENTLVKLEAAIRKGDQEAALALARYTYLWEGKALHDLYSDWAFANLDWLAKNHGEEEIPKLLRFVKESLDRAPYQKARKGAEVRDRVVMAAEAFRGHRSGSGEMGDLRVWEEPDRYVVELDPCGSGGRMMRGPLDGSGSRVGPPYNFGKTSRAYPWSWGKANVPYYCVHCCLWHEVMGTEARGYPLKVAECPTEDFQRPCRHYHYKDPDLIPEHYFERIGFKKDPAKFKR